MEKVSSRGVDKDSLVQAVVIADSYDRSLSPANGAGPPCLMELVNRPMLDYTLECLSASGVQEAIVFCSSYQDKIKQFVRDGRWGRMGVVAVACEGCRSLGDAMRDLDAKGLIRTDFVLLSGAVVGSLQLLPIIEKHRKLQKLDKGCAMSVVYKECGDKIRLREEELYVATDSRSGRLLYHSKATDHLDPAIHIPLESVMERDCLEVRCDLMDTGVSICSVSVPPLFSDNFDFETREDLIRGLLMNEDILASTLYTHVLPPRAYAAQVTNWSSYHSISRDIVHRWTYPQVPGGFIHDLYSYRFGNIYLQDNVSMETGSRLVEDVVVGRCSQVGQDSVITSSVVGRGCQIGRRVHLSSSHLLSNVILRDGCRVEYSVLGEGCIVEAGASLRSCILGPGVIVPAGKEFQDLRLQSTPSEKGEEGLGKAAFHYRSVGDGGEDSDCDESCGEEDGAWVRLGPPPVRTDYSHLEDVMSEGGSTLASADLEQPDDTNLFLSEVVDSLSRGLEDRLACDNLVLEVNSSRYAYNVSLREVNYHVSRAVLTVCRTTRWSSLSGDLEYLLPVLLNYVKNPEAMADCLSALEDMCECKEELRLASVKLLSYLYEKDVLSEEAILEWHANPRAPDSFTLDFRQQVSPFIKWLQEADEQTDSDE